METKSNRKSIIIAVIALVLAIATALGIYFISRPDTQEGDKNITVEVVLSDTSSKEYYINTSEKYLRGALEQKNLIEGDESEYGLFITEVAGVQADTTKNQWWGIYKGEQILNTGVDTTPIADGDKYKIVLNTGW